MRELFFYLGSIIISSIAGFGFFFIYIMNHWGTIMSLWAGFIGCSATMLLLIGLGAYYFDAEKREKRK